MQVKSDEGERQLDGFRLSVSSLSGESIDDMLMNECSAPVSEGVAEKLIVGVLL